MFMLILLLVHFYLFISTSLESFDSPYAIHIHPLAHPYSSSLSLLVCQFRNH